MSEELLKAIIQLFAIVAKERVTEDERANIKEFLSVHLNQDAIPYYLQLFDNHCRANIEDNDDLADLDDDTLDKLSDMIDKVYIYPSDEPNFLEKTFSIGVIVKK